jgi:hypothetical protein
MLLQGLLFVRLLCLRNFLSVEHSQLHRVLELLALTELFKLLLVVDHERGFLSPKATWRFHLLGESLFGIDTALAANHCFGEVLLQVIPLHERHQFALVVLLVLKIIKAVVMLDAYLYTQILYHLFKMA